MFVDGEFSSSSTFGSDVFSGTFLTLTSERVTTCHVGDNTASTRNFKFRNFLIFNNALQDSEVLALLNAMPATPEKIEQETTYSATLDTVFRNPDDYIETRRRNFEINKIYLDWQKKGLLDTLIFSKDDCAQYGFNVQEAQVLERMGGYIKTGADEIPLSLLSCAISGDIKICPIFLEPKCKDLISNYEDISIESSVYGQLELAGCKICDEDDADILLYINNFKYNQGEIVMNIGTEEFNGSFVVHDRPYMIADVRFANGADNNFISEFFKNKIDDKNFYGYSAWNTSANTLGSLICAAKIKFLAKKYNADAFKRLQITRFLDDWAYQANVRQILQSPDVEQLKSNMKSFEKIVGEILNTEVNVNYNFPWNRLFEVEVEFN